MPGVQIWALGHSTAQMWWTDRGASFQQPLHWGIQTNVVAGKQKESCLLKRQLKLFLTFPINGKIKLFTAQTVARAMWFVRGFFSLVISVSIQSDWCIIFTFFYHIFGLVKCHKLTLNFRKHCHRKIRHATLAHALTSNPANLGSSLWRGKIPNKWGRKVQEHCLFHQDIFFFSEILLF